MACFSGLGTGIFFAFCQLPNVSVYFSILPSSVLCRQLARISQRRLTCGLSNCSTAGDLGDLISRNTAQIDWQQNCNILQELLGFPHPVSCQPCRRPSVVFLIIQASLLGRTGKFATHNSEKSGIEELNNWCIVNMKTRFWVACSNFATLRKFSLPSVLSSGSPAIAPTQRLNLPLLLLDWSNLFEPACKRVESTYYTVFIYSI